MTNILATAPSMGASKAQERCPSPPDQTPATATRSMSIVGKAEDARQYYCGAATKRDHGIGNFLHFTSHANIFFQQDPVHLLTLLTLLLSHPSSQSGWNSGLLGGVQPWWRSGRYLQEDNPDHANRIDTPLNPLPLCRGVFGKDLDQITEPECCTSRVCRLLGRWVLWDEGFYSRLRCQSETFFFVSACASTIPWWDLIVSTDSAEQLLVYEVVVL